MAISVIEIKDKEILEQIEKDRKHFEKVIGGGKWRAEDVLREWIKILKTIEAKR
jgi:hypothetical protein